MKYHRVVVTPEFRRAAVELLPGLDEHVGHWRMLGILMFRTQSGYSRSMKTLLPYDLILDCYEDRSRRKSAHAHLMDFSSDVFQVELSGWIFNHYWLPNESRSVESMRPPKPLQQLVRDELASESSEFVYLDDGSPVSERSLKKGIKQGSGGTNDNSEVGIGSRHDHASLRVLSYLNTFPSNRFTQILNHVGEARGIAKLLPEPVRTQQLSLLREVELRPKPAYSPSERSTRIYSDGPSFLLMQADVRDCLIQDWVKLDLASCHLAVAATTWGDGLPLTHAFLEGKRLNSDQQSLWKTLADHMGIPLNVETKGAIKQAVYSLIYGMGEDSLNQFFEVELVEASGGFKHFIKQDFMAECWNQRRKELRNLQRAGYGIDAFGERILPPRYENATLNWRSVLAVRAQSFELALLLPAYELAWKLPKGHGFQVMMHLHDGIAIVADRQSETGSLVKRITESVDQKAVELGIPTWLERQS